MLLMSHHTGRAITTNALDPQPSPISLPSRMKPFLDSLLDGPSLAVARDNPLGSRRLPA